MARDLHPRGSECGAIPVEFSTSAMGQQRRFRDVRIMSASLNSRHGDGGSLTAQFVQSPSSMRLTAPSLALLAGNGRRLLLGGIEGKRLTYRAD
jgi:hypothetical protein